MTVTISRKKAASLMKALHILPSSHTGVRRAKSTKRVFETFETLADPYDYFIKAFNMELEHGRANSATDVTGDKAIETAKIVAAHLRGVEADEPRRKWKRFPAYYDWLIWIENNGRK